MTVLKKYMRLPDLQQWKNDSHIPDILVRRANDKPLCAIDAIVTAIQNSKSNGKRNYLMVELYFATNYWLRNFKSQRSGNMHPGRENAIRSLCHYAVEKMALGFQCGVQAVPTKLERYYGRTMGTHGKTIDATEANHYMKRADVEQYKLFFDAGKAYCFDWKNNRFGQDFVMALAQSKTIWERDQDQKSLQIEWARFAMSMSRDIYMAPHVNFATAERYNAPAVHSSYLGGMPVLCAGSLEIENGVVSGVKSDSGHYQPTYQQLMNVIQHLSVVGVNLETVSVCDFIGWPLGNGKEFMANNQHWRKRIDQTGQEFKKTNNLHDLVKKRVDDLKKIVYFSLLKKAKDDGVIWKAAYRSVCEDLSVALNDPVWRNRAEDDKAIPRRKAPAPPVRKTPPVRPSTPHPSRLG